MLAKVNAISLLGLDSQLVEVEADIHNGLPAFVIVGMANKAVDEAKERVRASLKNSKLHLPPRRITLNRAPADLPKAGSGFDLAMAVVDAVWAPYSSTGIFFKNLFYLLLNLFKILIFKNLNINILVIF